MESIDALKHILEGVKGGDLDIDEAARRLREMAAEPLGFATLDHHRRERCGAAEVIFAAGKTAAQVVAIAGRLIERTGHVLITRAEAEHAEAVCEAFDRVEADARRRTLLVGEAPAAEGRAIPIITAGTSDEAVAEEAAMTCKALGRRTARITDVGVAGLHRLIERIGEIRSADVVICIAGMEGALPSVVGGLVAAPVIAVPTSVGYGASFGGVAALLGMLNSCASGVVVVNIDNGFGAAYAASMIQGVGERAGNREKDGPQ